MAQNGAALSLRAVNEQDRSMTCDPETTFFKKRHPRYTHFAMAQLVQALGAGDSGSAPLLSTSHPNSPAHTIATTVHRTADLVGAMHMRTVLPALNTNSILNADAANVTATTSGGGVISSDAYAGGPPESTTFCDLSQGGYCYVDEVGHYLLSSMDLYLCGHRIDTLTSEQQYFNWHAERPDEMLMPQSLGIAPTQEERLKRAAAEQVIYSPIGFWFGKHPSQYFPLISMSSGEMSLRMTGRTAHNIYGGVDNGFAFDQYNAVRDDAIIKALAAARQDLVYDGIFLDAGEKAMFARVAQEYLITEHQQTEEKDIGAGAASLSIQRVNMQHPTRDLVVALRPSSRTRPNELLVAISPDLVYPVRSSFTPGEYHTPNQWNNFSGGTNPETRLPSLPLDSLKMKINGFDRFIDLDSGVGPFFHETHPSYRYPGRTFETFGQYYSFGLVGTGPSASGTMNMSALDQIDFALKRIPDPLSTMTAGGLLWDVALTGAVPPLYPPPEFQPVDVFVFSRPVNVLKIAGGIAGKAYAG